METVNVHAEVSRQLGFDRLVLPTGLSLNLSPFSDLQYLALV